MSVNIPYKTVVYNRVCLVCSDGGFQQVRAALKSPDVSSIHERLVATKMLFSAYIEQAILRLQVVLHASHQGSVFLERTRAGIYSSTLGTMRQDMKVP